MTPLLREALIALTMTLGNSPAAPLAGDSVLSRKLTYAALDEEAALNIDSALVLHRAARRADSTDAVAEYFYVALRRRRFELGALKQEYASSAVRWDSRGTFCWTPWLTARLEQRFMSAEVQSAERALGSSICSIVQSSLVAPFGAPGETESGARAMRLMPAVPEVWFHHVGRLLESQDPRRAETACIEGERATTHPFSRMQLGILHVRTRLMLGDTAGALALQGTVRSAVLRDGRPGMLHEYLSGLSYQPVLWKVEGGETRIFQRLLQLSEAAGDWSGASWTLADRGKQFIDRGEPLRAIPLLSRAIALADSVHVSDLQIIVRTLRGRAYQKAGRLAEAERDLLLALEASRTAARLYYRADVYHNLAHLYESTGRWTEAVHAVDKFVELSKLMTANGLGVTSLLDAGDIRWKAGWHASADAAFREMVRVADSTGDFYEAGQYFERSGDLGRAQTYYARGARKNPSNPIYLAGMTRVHSALGHADTAEVWARAHDAQIVDWPPLEVPLLPVALAARGRLAEATRIAHEWAERQIRSGNIEGAAIASLQVAQFLLDAGRTDSALTETIRTDSIARGSNFPSERIRAASLRGTALVRLGHPAAGVRTLDSALSLAIQHPSADILFETHLALGEALVASRRPGDAIREFDLAARSVERITLGLPEDLDRAGYRERNLRPFDDATRLLLTPTGDPLRIDELVRWSSRRSAAALAIAASGGAAAFAHEPRAPPLAELQRRLGPDETLLNYIVIDSTVSVIVIVNDSATLVRLPISAATLNARITEIRRPLVTTYSGRLDLARAPYAVTAAAELYSALIQPVIVRLAGKRRLFIAADGPLHALAFDALVVSPAPANGARPDYRETKYLLDAFEIEYLPSPAFLRSRQERSRTQRLDAGRLLAVGYGAPGSEAELDALRDTWPRARLTTIESGAATETAIRERMVKFELLHFAVHATADARDPLSSHLRLVADSVNDGYLHANEIAGTRITADLVVLSACETNAGPIYRSEGVMGIARAFLASGARAVVATQWPIGAETAVLMHEFYSRLARGETPGAALRAAKLMVRRQAATAHPIHWAGFLLVR